MEKKYVLVEVGGEICPLRGLNFCGVARVYCGDKGKCCIGHTDKEIIKRRAKAMHDRFEKVGCTTQSWSEAHKITRDSFLKVATTTLKADLEAAKK
jgi:hypothetical protein